jgi:hypothetical protein
MSSIKKNVSKSKDIWLLDLPPATEVKSQVSMTENEGNSYMMFLV